MLNVIVSIFCFLTYLYTIQWVPIIIFLYRYTLDIVQTHLSYPLVKAFASIFLFLIPKLFPCASMTMCVCMNRCVCVCLYLNLHYINEKQNVILFFWVCLISFYDPHSHSFSGKWHHSILLYWWIKLQYVNNSTFLIIVFKATFVAK